MENTPPFELFTLPSKGLFYKGAIPGTIHIRPMTLGDEKILTTDRLVKSGEAINMVFQRCIQEQFDVGDMLTADRLAVLLWLRGASYGMSYKFQVKCPHCKVQFNKSINIEKDLNITYAEDDMQEPFQVTLEKCKKTVSFILPRAKHEQLLGKLRKEAETKALKSKEPVIDNSLVDQLKLLVVNVEGVEQPFIEQWLNGLMAYDSSILKEAVFKDYFGVDTNLVFLCENNDCSQEIEMTLPITKNFFRVNS